MSNIQKGDNMTVRVIKMLIKYMKKCRDDRINAVAAQAAFFIVLSMIPFLMVISALIQYTPVTESMFLKLVSEILPGYVAPFMISIINEVYSKSIGIISVTAVAAIWSAAKGIQYLAYGLNVVNGVKENRNWLILRFWAFIYTAIFIVAIIALLILIVFGNAIQSYILSELPFLNVVTGITFRMRSLIVLATLILIFTILFISLPNRRELPDRRKLTFKNQLPGATLCALGWYLFSFGLSIYVDYFDGFSMYGSLTTITLVMLWLYFCMYIMMLGAEWNVIFEHEMRGWYRKRRTGWKNRGN